MFEQLLQRSKHTGYETLTDYERKYYVMVTPRKMLQNEINRIKYLRKLITI